jgi:hypothetical protein
MATAAKYHLFVITYHREKVKQTIRVRALDKRRAKNLAKRRLGDGIKILSAFRWEEHQKRLPTS